MFDFRFTALFEEWQAVLITGLLVGSLALFMWLWKIMLVQGMLLVGFWASEESFSQPLFWVLVALQVLLAGYFAFRLYTEIEWSLSRRLEKTLKLPRNITKNGNAGIRDYWF